MTPLYYQICTLVCTLQGIRIEREVAMEEVRSSGRVRKPTHRYQDEDIPDEPKPRKKRPKRKQPQQEKANNEKNKPRRKRNSPPPPLVQKDVKNPTGSQLHRKTKQGNSYYIKPKPQISFHIDESVEVDILTASAAQIKKAAKKQYRPTKKDKEALIQIPSHLNRAKIYSEAARAIAKKEANALPSHGARPWFVQITITDQQGSCGKGSSGVKSLGVGEDSFEVIKGKKGKTSSSPLFVWNKYHLELAVLPHILNAIDEIDTNRGLLKKAKEDAEMMEQELEDGYVTDEEEYIQQLSKKPISKLSTIASQQTDYVVPTIDRKWISPDLVTFRSRNAAVDHSLILLDKDKLIDKVLFGHGNRGSLLRPAKPTKANALEAGNERFIRDGLWVIGQEEDWIPDRISYLKEQQQQAQTQESVESKVEVCDVEVSNGDVKPSTEVKDTIAQNIVNDENINNIEVPAEANEEDTKEVVDIEANSNEGLTGTKIEESNSTNVVVSSDESSNISSPTTSQDEVKSTNSASVKSELEAEEIPSTEKSAGEKTIKELVGSKVLSVERLPTPPNVKAEKELAKKAQRKAKPMKIPSFSPSTHWRLTPNQITMCTNAVMEHYEKVMYTVKAKALYAELADGFDVFRERGRGRFDMTLEAFDQPEFDFLTDPSKTPWMEVVKKILGDDAVLVHKGAFLSMPGGKLISFEL